MPRPLDLETLPFAAPQRMPAVTNTLIVGRHLYDAQTRVQCTVPHRVAVSVPLDTATFEAIRAAAAAAPDAWYVRGEVRRTERLKHGRIPCHANIQTVADCLAQIARTPTVYDGRCGQVCLHPCRLDNAVEASRRQELGQTAPQPES